MVRFIQTKTVDIPHPSVPPSPNKPLSDHVLKTLGGLIGPSILEFLRSRMLQKGVSLLVDDSFYEEIESMKRNQGGISVQFHDCIAITFVRRICEWDDAIISHLEARAKRNIPPFGSNPKWNSKNLPRRARIW